MDSENFRVPFDITYRWTDGANEERFEMPVKFKNGYATVIVYFYHRRISLHHISSPALSAA